MHHDRDEWRRPWRPEDTPWLAAPTASTAAAAPPMSEPEPAPPVGADGDRDDIARYPQPPPAAWDERQGGPGSPVGSVRPPDTIGTVDAPEPSRRRGGMLTHLLAGLLGAVIGTVGSIGAFATLWDGGPAVTAPTIEINGEGTSVVPAVAQAVTPSVVSISLGVGAPAFGGQQAQGSGVIYRSDGYILTNHHVIEQAQGGAVRVRLSDGDFLQGEVVGSDPLSDLAVVRVDRDGLPAINLRPSDEPLRVGETAVAIGSPFGLEGSVTAGVVSAVNREIVVDEEDGAALVIPGVVQTDAAINPGNSGGALVDAQGRLIGINTAILTRTGANQGVGFAVPVDLAVVSADQIIAQGFVRHPLLGVSGTDVTPEIVEEFNLEVSRGAIVDRVQEGSGAAEAGLRSGDIIVGFDDRDIVSMSQLVAEVRRRMPGEVVTLRIVRDGQQLTVEVELGERPR